MSHEALSGHSCNLASFLPEEAATCGRLLRWQVRLAAAAASWQWFLFVCLLFLQRASRPRQSAKLSLAAQRGISCVNMSAAG